MWGTTKHRFVWLVVFFCICTPLQALAFGINPTTADVWAELGSSHSYTINVVNESDDVRSYTTELIGIEFDTENEIRFEELTSDVRSWIELSPSAFDLQAGQSEIVTVSVQAPEVQSSVSVIGVQVVEEPIGGGTIELTTVMTSLLFLTIGNEVEQGAELLDFSASNELTSQLPVTFFTTLRNVGDGILQPQGIVRIKNVFGMTVRELEINPRASRLVPGQVRTFSTSWGSGENQTNFFVGLREELSGFAIGVFSVEMELQPWTNSEVMHASKKVIVFPWRTLSVLALLLVGTLFILKYRKATSI